MKIVNMVKNLLNKRKIDAYELLLRKISKLSIEVNKTKVEDFKFSNEIQLSIRILKNKKIGFTYLTDLNINNAQLEQIIENTISSLSNIDRDGNYTIYEGYEHLNISSKDSKIESLTSEKMIELSKLIEENAYNFDKRIKIVKNAGVKKGELEIFYTNSFGSEKYYSSNFIGASVVTVAEDENESFMGYENFISRKMDLNIEEIAKNASNKAVRMFGAKKGKSMKCPVILENELVCDILSLISSSFYYENIDKKKSLFFSNKPGEKVANEIFNLMDNGIEEGLNGTVPFDDEGVPTTKKYLLKNGILNHFLNNVYYSKKFNHKPTGNGFKPSFKSQPATSVTNLILEKGKISLEEGIKRIENGIYITNLMGLHMANPISGDFSLGAEGIIIENGEMTRPVKEIVITGNLKDILLNTKQIFNDVKASGSIYAPSILVDGLNISG